MRQKIRWCAFVFQRQFLNLKVRDAARRAIASVLPKTTGLELSAKAEVMVADLQTRGYHLLAGGLAQKQIDEILDVLKNERCTDPYRPEKGKFAYPDEVPEESHLAHYSADALLRCPHLLEFANQPDVLAAIERILGCKPTLSGIYCWWSIPGKSKPEEAQFFHRDVDDWSFVKLLVYLTDVDEESGPHAFVSGSHNDDRLLGKSRFSESDVHRAFGEETVVRFTGKRGTAFLENTFGIHRGTPPKSKERLLLQFFYTLLPVHYAPARPIPKQHCWLPAQPIDSYINRLLLQT